MLLYHQIIVQGQVQGVGFRPFIFRLAHEHQLKGEVRNLSGQVRIRLYGEAAAVQSFEQKLILSAPPLARPYIVSSASCPPFPAEQFIIARSSSSDNPDIHVPPDFFCCDDCLTELRDPTNRRYHYPFINCTQCGPRYTLIRALPYDRPNTTMADFPLCPDCAREYHDPLNRRFDAQPVACERCGPQCSLQTQDQRVSGNAQSIRLAVDLLSRGQIIAVKGIGGYHLVCDAQNDVAVMTLRERKQRPHKPLAVMLPPGLTAGMDDVDSAKQIIDELINQPLRPIVLVDKAYITIPLSEGIAPGLREYGVFLPYSPLHYLILAAFKKPLVMSSANISGEPVICEQSIAEAKLSGIADAFLHHNRPVQRPADDSIIKLIAAQARVLRIGRGLAPLEMPLPIKLQQPVIALGGQLKTTIAIAWNDRCVISAHISNMGSVRAQQVLLQLLADFPRLYQVTPIVYLADSHPDYSSHRWLKKQGVAMHTIWHHYAHAAAVAAEYPAHKNWLCFTWDGTGLGVDGSLWGGETLIGQPGKWQRQAALRPFYLPGGDKAGHQPWRSAAAVLWQMGKEWMPQQQDAGLARQAWFKKINCPRSSGAGRLFDAAACIITGTEQVSYEGQAAIELEALCMNSHDDFIDMPLTEQHEPLLWVDWQPLFDRLCNPQLSMAYRAELFHNSLARGVVEQILYFQQHAVFDAIGLGGGVFHNKYLVEKIGYYARQRHLQLPILLPQKIPAGDGGLCFGQVVEYAAQRNGNTYE